ncbi:hypothetical protein [Acidipropionibacterium jensenii]|uniref:hypothetical protein n=1 Tax=Acidipropionibacterium jensenii TaxID=1749 RepID=UPI0034541E41
MTTASTPASIHRIADRRISQVGRCRVAPQVRPAMATAQPVRPSISTGTTEAIPHTMARRLMSAAVFLTSGQVAAIGSTNPDIRTTEASTIRTRTPVMSTTVVTAVTRRIAAIQPR